MESQKYLFRGKRLDNGQWVEGHYSTRRRFIDVRHYIQPIQKGETVFFEVKPETVGVFTGLLDKNGTMVFEGNLLKSPTAGRSITYFEVRLEPGQFALHHNNGRWGSLGRFMDLNFDLEIIGNIHDNPELLTTTPQ